MGHTLSSLRSPRLLLGTVAVAMALILPATASAATVSGCETNLKNATAFPAADRAGQDYSPYGGYGNTETWKSLGGYISTFTGHAICEGQWQFKRYNGSSPYWAYRYQGDLSGAGGQFTYSYEGRFSWTP